MANNMQDPDQAQEGQEGGATLTVTAADYNLGDIQQGDRCKINGTVSAVNDDGTVDITPDSIEPDVNPAQKSMEKMMGGKKKPAPPMQADDSGEY